MKKITIETGEGNITIDAELLKEYRQRAFETLKAQDEAKLEFKEEVDAAADGAESTTVEKKVLVKILGKYFKAAYKDSTKEAKELGEVFAALDEAVA
jgi:hypothetical protein